ncbi:mycofactocin biosynthesis chaperone MftB [Jatrophihabitans sp. YIM 134969]
MTTPAPGSTVEPAAAPAAAGFDLDAPWRLDDRVSVRPEPFGALLYHFGTRRLTFLKSPLLLDVVRGLADHPTARAACLAAGVADDQVARYTAALASLVDGDMIVRR